MRLNILFFFEIKKIPSVVTDYLQSPPRLLHTWLNCLTILWRHRLNCYGLESKSSTTPLLQTSDRWTTKL